MNASLWWSSSLCLCLTVGYVCYRYLQASRHRPNTNTDFSSFLIRTVKTHPSPTDFSSFLKSPTAKEGKNDVEEIEEMPLGAVPVPVLYGTEFGFSKEVAEKLCDVIRSTGDYWGVTMNLADYPKGLALASEQLLLFVCSTQGDGVPPYDARAFCEWLFAGEGIGNLSETKFSVCALGDRSYAHYCRCGRRIRKALLSKGSQECIPSVKIDREDWNTVDKWIRDVCDALPALHLTPEQTNITGHLSKVKDDVDGWSKGRPFGARLLHRRNLCRTVEPDDKITVHIDLDIAGSGLRYLPGDAVGVYPVNRREDVQSLLTALDVDPSLMLRRPSWSYRRSDWNTDDEVSIEEVLMTFYDLRSPKLRLLECLREHLHSEEENRGQSLTSLHDSGQSIDRLDDQEAKLDRLEKLLKDADDRDVYLRSRHVIDILTDFDRPPLSIVEFLTCLRPLQPRLYSVSSSQKDTSDRVSLTVAEVKYRSHGRDRFGVASTFLTERTNIDDTVWIYISINPDFRLPKSLKTPLLMIGPGTGLAPFRSFVLEKLAAGDKDLGVNYLFFGCRRRDKDYLYGDQLEEWDRRGTIKLHTAFSREQDRKVYVQDKLKQHKEAIWNLIQDGCHIYVCGDAQYMAPDVHASLLDILSSHLPSHSSPQQYLHSLEHSSRYQRDVWF